MVSSGSGRGCPSVAGQRFLVQLSAQTLGGTRDVVSKAEEAAGRTLRSVLADVSEGEQIAESEDFQELQSALEYFLPSILRDTYPAQWRHESLDAFRFAVARKTGPLEAELLGLCLLISDQTWTPVHIHLRAAAEAEAISWVSCKLGDGGPAGKRMTRLPYESTKVSKLLFSVSEHPENID